GRPGPAMSGSTAGRGRDKVVARPRGLTTGAPPVSHAPDRAIVHNARENERGGGVMIHGGRHRGCRASKESVMRPIIAIAAAAFIALAFAPTEASARAGFGGGFRGGGFHGGFHGGGFRRFGPGIGLGI